MLKNLDFVPRVVEVCKLDERQTRLFYGCVAEAYGYGGISAVAIAARSHNSTVSRGVLEVRGELELPKDNRIRRVGGGRRRAAEMQPGLEQALRKLVAQHLVRDSPYSLPYVGLSLRHISALLKEQGFQVSHGYICKFLRDNGYRTKYMRCS